MKYKKFIVDYFSFTQKETTGIVALVILILLIFLIPFLFPLLKKEDTRKMDQEFIAAIKELKADTSKKEHFEKEYFNDYSIKENHKGDAIINPHTFDPNTLSESGWIQMGVKPRTAATIRNYINKGGRFKSPEDLKKIYGLSASVIDKLLPFVSITSIEKDRAEKNLSPAFANQNYTAQNYKPRVISPVNINRADTTEWIALPGIGSKLSQRIIAFRDKLGGFYSIDQVGETFLLPDSTFQKIKPYLVLENSIVKKININIATVDEMKIHPYLRYNIANAIVQYRIQHGDFKSIDEVKKIVIISEDIFRKVAPYLALN